MPTTHAHNQTRHTPMVAIVGLVSSTALAQSQSDNTLSTKPLRHCDHNHHVRTRENGDALLCTSYNEAKEREIQSLQSLFADSLENKHHWQQCNAIEQPQETCGTTREVRALRIAGTRTEEHEPKNIAMETLCSSGMNFRIIVVYTA